MRHKRIFKQNIAVLVAGCILLGLCTPVSAAPGQTLHDKVDNGMQVTDSLKDDVYYQDYLADGASKGYTDYTGDDIVLAMNQGIATPQQTVSVQSVADDSGASKDAVVWNKDSLQSLEWNVDITQAGYYNIAVDYLPIAGSTTAPQRKIYIDGAQPCKEMNIYSLPRNWEDDGDVWVNAIGDQVRPKAKEIFQWSTSILNDMQGEFSTPMKYYLSAGTHNIKIAYANEPVAIHEIRLVKPSSLPTYEQYLAEQEKAGNKPATQSITIQGEDTSYKSDPSLRIQSDSDPKDTPVADGHVVYNSVGGTVWKGGNQSITWNIDVPESGLYKLSFRWYQKYTDGLPVYRQIAVDGHVPFQEFLDYKIDFTGWTYQDLVDQNNQPYEIYLEAGKPHTITLTVKTGDYDKVISTLEKNAYTLGNIVQKIIKVTGVTPDGNYDYHLDQKIPSLMDDMQALSDSLGGQVKDILALSTKRPSAVNNLLMIKSQLDGMIKDPYIIAGGLNQLMTGQSTMATWINDFQNAPLLIDYFTLQPPGAKTKDYHSNFFARLGVAFKTFTLSFVKDYDSVGNASADSKMPTLNLWISRAKEWAEVLQYMSDEDFTRQYGVNVKMNVVPANTFTTSGVIMLAIAAGDAPDLALGVSSSVPFEYGIRDSLTDLSQFPDFNEVSQRFLPGIMIPFEYQGQTFALPETMDFSVLFYRKDIMSNLKLNVPDTWGDLYSRVLPILKENGMDFFYDGSVSSVSGSVSAAFHSLLYQNGGSYYTDDGKKSALDSPAAFTAFKQFTDLYTIYNVPVAANFYTRFRTGQIPIGVSSFGAYIQLTAAAPEISGKWDVAPLPGVRQADGTINRSYGGSTTAAIILKGSKLQDESWNFLKWYTETDTQVRYANDIVTTVGSEARWCSANLEAFDSLSWETNLKNVIQEQRQWYVDMPNVIGGYITPRYIENARVRTVVQGKQYRDSLEQVVKDINRELDNKNQEFAMRASKEAGSNS